MDEKRNVNFAWPITAISKENYSAVMECVKANDDVFSTKKILIFGAGIRGAEISVILSGEGYKNIIFTDNNEQKWGGVIDNYPIISVAEALEMKKDSVFLVSVEEGNPICRQLEAEGLKENKDFFFPKPDLYDRFMKEFEREMNDEVLIMGDCMFEVVSFDDDKKDSLTEIMQQILGYKNVKHLTMHGMGLPTFYHMFKAQLNNGMKPSVFAVMLNFETLTGKQHLLPRSQHTELVKRVSEISKDPEGELKRYAAVTEERVKNIQAEFFTTNKFASNKKMNNNRGEISDSAAKMFLKLNYMYKLNPEIESIQYLKKIMQTAQENEIKLLPFVPPVNYERGIELFGDTFETAYQYNLNLLKDIVSTGGFHLLDLSHICTKELFAHTTTPDETTNYAGRQKVALYLCDKISKLKEKDEANE